MKIYEVGGCVRDKLLGKEANDFDHVITGATPDEMLRLGFKQVGKNFPVFLKDGQEYALARQEIKTGDKHSDFKFIFTPDITLQQDLERRDFTCNALMQDVLTSEIIDHFGGVNDLNNKILRHINDETFIEDPLRVLRAAQFASRFNFNIADETLRLCASMDINTLSRERIYLETEKALLKAEKPSVYFEILRKMDKLSYWFSELQDLIGIKQKSRLFSVPFNACDAVV